MDTKISYVYQKDLIGLGMKKSDITKIVNQSEYFKDVPKHQGHSIAYSFEQSVAVAIACELSNLGLSFRHVDIILSQVKHVEDKIRILHDDILFLGKSDNLKLQYATYIDGKRKRLDAIYKSKVMKVRTARLLALTMKYEELKDFINSSQKTSGYIGGFFCLDLREIRDIVMTVFK
jgi:hypothetical protein